MLEAVGTLFYCRKTKRSLYLLRTSLKYFNTWGLVGGKIEPNESVFCALNREIKEEIGFLPKIIKYIPIETFTSNDQKFQYHTYICIVDDEFTVSLNHEHSGYVWILLDPYKIFLKPLHPGVFNFFNLIENQVKIQKIKSIF